MKIFITGGSGQIGSHLIDFLNQKNDPKNDSPFVVKIYDIVNNPLEDILNYDYLLQEMINFEPQIIIHLAALSNITDCNNNPGKALIINGNGSGNVMKAAVECKTIKKIIYASTASVYGDLHCNNDESLCGFKEDDILDPDSIYGISKLVGETIITSYLSKCNIELNIIRMFNVVIKNKNLDRLFAAIQKPNFMIYGNDYNTEDGTCIRDYISINDVCSAIHCLINSQSKEQCNIYNISTGKGTSVLEIIKLFNMEIKYGPRRQGDINKSIGNNEKMRNLGWEPKDTITSIIKNFV